MLNITLDGELVKPNKRNSLYRQLSDIKGTHDLRVVANGNNGVSMTREYQLVSYAPAEKQRIFLIHLILITVRKMQ